MRHGKKYRAGYKITQHINRPTLYMQFFFFFRIIYNFYVGSMFLTRRLFSSLLRFLPRQFSLRQLVPGVIQPPPIWSSPPFSRHLHHHHYFAYIIILLFSIHAHTTTTNLHYNILSCTFLDISSTFVFPLILSFLLLFSLATPLNTQ